MRARRRAELPPPATASRGRKRKTARRAPGRSIPPWPGLPWPGRDSIQPASARVTA
ncbi:conserved hypothetical protein [Burkholderia pseudomallei 1106b]|uniref:Uncharacterized protein n=1 Tax=Burkholderia pseudomallei (strain 1106a) TaxID=357348 RepID=A3NPZ3_BURP0|nr:conserved hypothetical protein [Burkholderia pseudomallei 1106a]EEH30844.1 conserved hypothetical protein [Burkholderia pseudomallei Pakistan 9]EES26689.1 conserved hypothetical protein [Burkholderia pseudomallei 1106b]